MYVPYCRRYERELFRGRLRNILVVKDKNQIEDLSSHPLRYLALLTYAIPTINPDVLRLFSRDSSRV
jgi:hypothetical protein